MKLPQVLKQAVLTSNWDLVCTVYTTITGEPLFSPTTETKTLADMDIDLDIVSEQVPSAMPTKEENIEDLNTAKGISLVDEEIEDVKENEPDVSFEEDIQEEFTDCVVTTKGGGTDKALQGSKCRNEPLCIPQTGTRHNKFKDDRRAFARQDVTKYTHDKNGLPLGVHVATGNRYDTSRDTGKQVTVTCNVCGKKQKVSASLAIGHNNNPEYNRWKCNTCCSKGGKTQRGGE